MGSQEQTVAVPIDRRVGLIIFGILVLLLAGLCFLEVLGLGFVILIGDRFAGLAKEQINLRSLLPTLLLYLALGAAFTSLGVGSILCRRWARTLLHLLSTGWLAVGVPTVLFMAYVLPRMLAAMPGMQNKAAVTLAVFFVDALLALLFVAIPLALYLFYRSPHVKATCERRDPRPRWTDSCPPAVLGLALLGALGGVQVMLYVPVYRAVPIFGWAVEGLAGKGVLILGGTLSIVLAWFLYRMRAWAFWATLLLCLGWIASGVISLKVLGWEGLMRLGEQEVPAQSLAMFQAMPGWALGVFMGVTLLLWLLLILAAGRAILRPQGAPISTSEHPLGIEP